MVCPKQTHDMGLVFPINVQERRDVEKKPDEGRASRWPMAWSRVHWQQRVVWAEPSPHAPVEDPGRRDVEEESRRPIVQRWRHARQRSDVAVHILCYMPLMELLVLRVHGAPACKVAPKSNPNEQLRHARRCCDYVVCTPHYVLLVELVGLRCRVVRHAGYGLERGTAGRC